MVEYDNDQLRGEILKVLSDERLRRRFGDECRKLVGEEFGWDKVVGRLERIYKGITLA